MSLQAAESLDKFAPARNALREIAFERGDYAGYPMPLAGQRLIIEPTYKYKDLALITEQRKPDIDFDVVNSWWSNRLRARIAIAIDRETGKYWWGPMAGSANQGTAILNTIGACDAWGLEQEQKALQTLGGLVRHHQMKQYVMTGMFIESSATSGVFYVFRRLKPTIAMRPPHILACLCMHPIGYYEESWAGCMCPTDDVIAHLLLMRGDEHMFWRRCEQHSPQHPSAGL